MKKTLDILLDIFIMKYLALIFFAIMLLCSFSGCDSRDNSKILESYKYEAEGGKLNNGYKKKWARGQKKE